MQSPDFSGHETDLVAEIIRLKEEIRLLREKLTFLLNHPTIQRGLRGESIVLSMVQEGVPTERGLPYDITLPYTGVRLEVKYSSLIAYNKGRDDGRRWHWMKPFGESGKKRYDRLILVGDVDIRFSNLYKDPRAPFVIFDIPFPEVLPICIHAGGSQKAIDLNTNPSVVRGRARKLYEHYQLNSREFLVRYGA